ncbi:MAG: DUF881 domain-containing protein [Mycobacteriaceae bacterium]
MTQHLDPGYAAAHQTRSGRPEPRGHRVWLAAGALVVGALLGVAATSATRTAPENETVRSGLVSDVQSAQRDAAALVAQRNDLSRRADAERQRSLAGDADGRAALRELDRLRQQAAETPVHGPGVQVTVTDSPATADPSGAPGVQRGTVLDRDLQLVVNALWAAGAEAVGVNGVRLNPASTIRQAGAAMLVDDRPVPSPYVVSAVGEPRSLQTGFLGSDAYLRLSAVAQVYGIGLAVVPATDLQLPESVVPELRLAEPTGTR